MNENINSAKMSPRVVIAIILIGLPIVLVAIGAYSLATACYGCVNTSTKAVAPIETIDDCPCVVVDTDCVAHKILSRRLSNLHHGMYIEDVEGHSLCVFADKNGIASFIHITPCKRCAEEEFYKTHKLEPTRFRIGNDGRPDNL